MDNEKIKIKAIKTDIGYFCQVHYNGRYDGCESCLKHLFFDGEKPTPTYNRSWDKIPKVPKKIEKEVARPNTNYRFELIDKSLKSPKFPLVFTRDAVSTYNSEDGYWIWKDEFAQLKSLYAEKSDPQPPIMVDVPFEFNICLEMDKIKEYGGFSYPIQKTHWASDGYVAVTEKDIAHQEIDTIIFPDIVLPARESHLTSHQTFRIIRKHVQDNINPKYAHITSDYDFCFTVKKKIPLAKKVPYQKDVSRYGARKPKYVTDYRENREIEVFQMTHSGHNNGQGYQNYTIIEAFKGKNVEELKENIDNYLADLMETINSPVVDCKHCCGKGIVLEESQKVNNP